MPPPYCQPSPAPLNRSHLPNSSLLALAPLGGEDISWAGPRHPQPTPCDREYLSHWLFHFLSFFFLGPSPVFLSFFSFFPPPPPTPPSHAVGTPRPQKKKKKKKKKGALPAIPGIEEKLINSPHSHHHWAAHKCGWYWGIESTYLFLCVCPQ